MRRRLKREEIGSAKDQPFERQLLNRVNALRADIDADLSEKRSKNANTQTSKQKKQAAAV